MSHGLKMTAKITRQAARMNGKIHFVMRGKLTLLIAEAT
tara:strand:+ start:1368 stop:1484 length:117 start_codon:yes stop_codon:yes gene_type:complete